MKGVVCNDLSSQQNFKKTISNVRDQMFLLELSFH